MTRPFRKAKPKIAEGAVLSAGIKWAWAKGCFVYRQNTGGYRDKRGIYVSYGLAGSSDAVGLLPIWSAKPGVFLALEAKRPGGVQSDKQKQYQERVEACGGIYVLFESIEDLERELGPLLAR